MFNSLRGNAKMDKSEPADAKEDEKTLSVPKSTLGLHPLYPIDDNDTNACLDIVFVHGLGGDSYSTWTDDASNKMWPAHFLPQSPKFAKSRIMTFGYNAAAFVTPGETKTNDRLFAFGEQLLVALNDARIEDYQIRRPLVLVGHSLGGLVIKSALVYARARSSLYKDIVDSVNALIFFGTPHQGANIADCTVTAELGLWSKPILDLNNLFTEQAADQNVSTFWEMEKYLGVQVVDEGSARMGNVKKEVSQGLKRNHRTICEFASADESEFGVVLRRFNAIATEIQRGLPIALPATPTGDLSHNRTPAPPHDEDLEERLRRLRG
ncbi:unnamed protein product [Alternaria alternata]